ncbi:hypothetical protein N7462_006073 [Penicillium macrosclerotiorum]|uniref:uncharacterized protein n=1 Tax=Penicillium macrosclerotiorum TaxID=303699 RepID=UPI00254795A1|nr:uncharacterized protein N7462_006073 [Penicillium macrosclerotiorum]KAJ5682908.1 hypothetical protein N7462_006073 [Penicillium macrosclerotiorum]
MTFEAMSMEDILDRNDAFLRPCASWRRMLVQQPLAISLAWVDREISSTFYSYLRRWQIPVGAYNGLRMGMLYDLLIQFSKRVRRGFYRTFSDSVINAVSSEPNLHEFYEHRYAGSLKAAMNAAAIALDTCTADKISYKFQSNCANDKWSRDLIWSMDLPVSDGPVQLPDEMDEDI